MGAALRLRGVVKRYGSIAAVDGVDLVRNAVFGFDIGSDAIYLGVLLVFALITWRVAIAWMQRRLVD